MSLALLESVQPAKDILSSERANQFMEALARLVSAETILRRNEPLARRTTLRVGGPAEMYVEPASEAELAEVLRFCREQRLPCFVLGRGSNLIIRDGGISGLVICLAHAAFSRITVSEAAMECGAGARLKAVAVEAKRHRIGGLEFLEGIPGSVGGALRMNAGALGAWTFRVVRRVRYMDYAGEIYEQPADTLPVGYRSCPLFKDHIALSALFEGRADLLEEIEGRMRAGSRKRWGSQPAAPSAGCTFKNPLTIPAGQLIEELGLKGKAVGGARISEVHGNFIVNDGTARARDVLALIELVKREALSQRDIQLETEVEIVGEDEPSPGQERRKE